MPILKLDESWSQSHEQLRRSGLVIDEMDNPEQSTNNLTSQQAKIVFDSIPQLMDMAQYAK